MVGASLVQALDTLEYQFDGCLHVGWSQHLNNFIVYLVYRKRLVHGAHAILHLLLGLLQLALTSQVGVVNQLPHAALLNQRHGGTEGTELLQSGHVYTVVVGVAYLWRT